MLSCPSHDQLRRHVEDARSDGTAVGIASHIAGCTACRARVENLLFDRSLNVTSTFVWGKIASEAGVSPGTSTGEDDFPSRGAVETGARVPGPASTTTPT